MISKILANYRPKQLMTKVADEYLWPLLFKNIPGIEGIYLRYWYLKLFAKRVEGFVLVQRGVHLMNSYGLSLGKDVYINRGCHIDAYGGLEIEEGAALGPHVIIVTIDHGFLTRGTDYKERPWVERPIKIGARSMISANSYVNPGVTIGRDVVVSACTAVLCDLPDGSRVSGNALDTYAQVMRRNIKLTKELES